MVSINGHGRPPLLSRCLGCPVLWTVFHLGHLFGTIHVFVCSTGVVAVSLGLPRGRAELFGSMVAAFLADFLCGTILCGVTLHGDRVVAWCGICTDVSNG